MNKIRMTRTGNRDRITVFATALIISALFLFVFFFFGNVYYDAGDDASLNLIAAGAYSPRASQYLVFENIVLGYIFKILYRIFPYINCYLIFFITMSCLSMFLVSAYASLGLLGIRARKRKEGEELRESAGRGAASA